MDDGHVSPVGLLEGERLCCLDLAEFEQPDHHMTTVAEVLSRLHRQRDVQDCMRYNALRDLRAQMKQDLDNMIHQHSLEFKNLKQRQEHQWKTARGRAAHMLAAKRTEGYRRQSELLQEQIQMMEEAEGVPSVSPQKYGPPVMVTLRKGPCRASGGLPTTANVCLSARIAQAVSLEDDIYDHFYSYK
ncbi:hypothetical protein MAR_017785 [Mya arenaria]|uniref:Uncharacterized protein n=1 Tax=Mya arenaria TaxID=6604 RepID=A0ABY7EG71_MYAAR|nr:hypothetical protein MAR_017785 [Mya arenaria]